jgi:hypothetical protein
MLSDENNRESRSFTDEGSSNHPESEQTPNEGLELKLTAGSNENLYIHADGAWSQSDLYSGRRIHFEPLFVIQTWHRFYAKALMEADPAKRPAIVALAEGAILDRYVELFVSQIQTEETEDLQRAIAALTQLKEAHAIESTTQQFVA